MKPSIAFKGGKTDTVRFLPDDRPMIDLGPGLVEIAWKIPATLVGQRSRQNLHEFEASMPVSRQMKPRSAFQQHDFFVRITGNLDLAPCEAWSQPSPWTDLAVTHRPWKFYSQIRVLSDGPLFWLQWLSNLKPLHGASEQASRERDGWHLVEDSAANGLEVRHTAAADGTSFEMDGYDKRRSGTQRPARHTHQRFVAGMMVDGHISLSNKVRSRFNASRTRDFTVPSGMPSSRAISGWGFSAKNASLTMVA